MINKINNCAPSDRENKDWELYELAEVSELPKEFSRNTFTPEVVNQGQIGSCVGQTIRVVFSDTVQCKDDDLSAMWIYKRAKEYDYWEGEDYSGTSISGACEAVRRVGSCLEEFYPYNGNTENVEPLKGAKEDAAKRKIKNYFQVSLKEIEKVKNLLLKESLAFSMNIHSKFYEAKENGIVISDGYFESKRSGGHAMALTGWKEIEGILHWEFQNSWGIRWGDKGFVYIPHDLCIEAATSGCYYLIEANEIDKAIHYGPKRKDKRNFIIKFVHAFLNTVLKLFKQKPKFGPEGKKK